MATTTHLTCQLCGQEHRRIPLEPGEKALCTRCDCLLEQGSRMGPHAALVFSVTGIALALPAALLPFVSAGKLGDERTSLLFTGAERLWHGGMECLSLLVILCGGLIPLALLATLSALRLPLLAGNGKRDPRLLLHLAHVMDHWAIPEVQVLAVLVALMKLGSVVDVSIGPGFWFYCAMALSLLLARRSFEFEPAPPRTASAGGGA